ncbi:glycosyltransferase [Aquirufa regiilacus]
MIKSAKNQVHYFPLQAHCFAFGGFDLQMLSALNAINELEKGCVVKPNNLWDKDTDFQIAHFWGLDISHFNQITWAKRSGKIVVLTALLSYFESFQERFRHEVSSCIGIVRILKKIVAQIDALVVVSEEQKQIAISKFDCQPSKVFVIPNMVEKSFWQVENRLISDAYILSVGNICQRKNQVNLAKACIKADVNLILVGDTQAGEDAYAAELKGLVANVKNVQWIKGLPQASEELVELINNCSGFSLISNQETQPISLLEAAVLQKPLLISNRAFANQTYYSNACLVDGQEIDSIVEGIHKLKSNPNNYIPNLANLEACQPNKVAMAYADLYNHILLG